MTPTAKIDIHQVVTDQIIAMLENHQAAIGNSDAPWINPFSNMIFKNGFSGNNYHGINCLILMAKTHKKSYESELWMTFKQAQENGTPVKKGEKSTTIVHYGTFEVDLEPIDSRNGGTCGTDENDKKTISYIKTHKVFNVAQLEGYVAPLKAESDNAVQPFVSIEAAENILKNSKANYSEVRGNQAFYRPSTDSIVLPERTQFKTEQGFYSVAMHELVHWTGHKSRLNREFSGKFGSDSYAFEELIAEIGSAFICTSLGIESKTLPGHVNYIASWLTVLKNNKKAIFLAAAQAQKAFSLLTQEASSSENVVSKAA